MHGDPVDDQREVQDHEADEDRQQHHDRFAHPAEVGPVISTISTISVVSLNACALTGSRLKNASTPLASDVATVST